MEEKLKDEIRKAISKYKAVRYVYINKKEAFYLFKNFEQPIEDVIEDVEGDDLGGAHVVPIFIYDWVILHNGKIIRGLYNHTNEIKEIQKYIPYCEDESAHDFSIKAIIANDIKINSPKYLTPIRNLFRELGLIKETRGKNKREDEEKKGRDLEIILLYKAFKRKKPYPISKIFEKMKYDASFATIRRVLNRFNKK